MCDVFFVQVCGMFDQICVDGFYKIECEIVSFQVVVVWFVGGVGVFNFCVNNYLGLVNDLCLFDVVKVGFDQDGFGMVLVCFICGM